MIFDEILTIKILKLATIAAERKQMMLLPYGIPSPSARSPAPSAGC
jgi:hypothetical protein